MLNNPLSDLATEEVVRRLTEKIGKINIDRREQAAPAEMDFRQVQVVIDYLAREEFLEDSLIYEPIDMTLILKKSPARYIMFTQVIGASENAVAFHEDEAENAKRYYV